MRRSTRRTCSLTFVLRLLLVLALPGTGAAAQSVAPVSPEAARAWGFDRTDLPPHPGVRFGVLSNGMRYAIMRNAVPAGALSVRLRFDAGARVEGQRERGFMHLVEHLLFHGTANIPDGALPLLLAQRGMRHFTDINAFTSFEETVYRLDMSRSDAPARTAALLVMNEVATGLQFTRSAVRGAKKDVREEIAKRDAVQDRILAAQNRFFLPGTAIDRGPVAGTGSQVGRASSESLRRLYDLHYRPERATLILVGDFDPPAVEAEIATRFSGWQGRGLLAPASTAPALRSGRGLEARLFVDRNAPTILTVAALEPLGGSDAGPTRDAALLRTLGARMFNRRLARLASAPQPLFAAADLAIYDYYSTARLARIEIEARDRDWAAALRATAFALARASSQGFSQAELDEQVAAMRVPRARAAAPDTSAQLADAIADAVNRRIVFTAPADPAGVDAYLDRVRLLDVNAAFRSVWAGPGPLIFLSHNRRIPDAEATILSAWREGFVPR
jgi:zinc protease